MSDSQPISVSVLEGDEVLMQNPRALAVKEGVSQIVLLGGWIKDRGTVSSDGLTG